MSANILDGFVRTRRAIGFARYRWCAVIWTSLHLARSTDGAALTDGENGWRHCSRTTSRSSSRSFPDIRRSDRPLAGVPGGSAPERLSISQGSEGSPNTTLCWRGRLRATARLLDRTCVERLQRHQHRDRPGRCCDSPLPASRITSTPAERCASMVSPAIRTRGLDQGRQMILVCWTHAVTSSVRPARKSLEQ